MDWIRSTLNSLWKDWCWNSNTLATWCEELTHWKRPWCWERLRAGEEGDDRGWDGWMASPSQWTWVWASSRRWWRTRKPGVLQSLGSQRVRHNWVTEQHNLAFPSLWGMASETPRKKKKKDLESLHSFIHSLIQSLAMRWCAYVTPGAALSIMDTTVRKVTCLSSQRASSRRVETVISAKPHTKQCSWRISCLPTLLSVSSMEMIFCPYGWFKIISSKKIT